MMSRSPTSGKPVPPPKPGKRKVFRNPVRSAEKPPIPPKPTMPREIHSNRSTDEPLPPPKPGKRKVFQNPGRSAAKPPIPPKPTMPRGIPSNRLTGFATTESGIGETSCTDIKTVVSDLKQCSFLHKLDLQYCDLTKKNLALLADGLKHSFLKIHHLDIRRNIIEDGGIPDLVMIIQHCDVQKLTLNSCWLSAQRLVALQQFLGKSKLEVLDMSIYDYAEKNTKVKSLTKKFEVAKLFDEVPTSEGPKPSLGIAKVISRGNYCKEWHVAIMEVFPNITKSLKLQNWQIDDHWRRVLQAEINRCCHENLCILYGPNGNTKIEMTVLAKAEAEIPIQGKRVGLGGSEVTFPPQAVNQTTKVQISLDYDKEAWSSEKLCDRVAISPVIRCEPSGLVFNNPVLFEINTWVGDTSTEEVGIFWREDENSDWLLLETKTFKGHKISFKCSHFCLFVVIARKILDRLICELRMSSYLFLDSAGNFTALFCRDPSDHVNELHARFIASGYTSIYPAGIPFSVCYNKTVHFELSVQSPDGFAFRPEGGHTFVPKLSFQKHSDKLRLLGPASGDSCEVRWRFCIFRNDGSILAEKSDTTAWPFHSPGELNRYQVNCNMHVAGHGHVNYTQHGGTLYTQAGSSPEHESLLKEPVLPSVPVVAPVPSHPAPPSVPIAVPTENQTAGATPSVPNIAASKNPAAPQEVPEDFTAEGPCRHIDEEMLVRILGLNTDRDIVIRKHRRWAKIQKYLAELESKIVSNGYLPNQIQFDKVPMARLLDQIIEAECEMFSLETKEARIRLWMQLCLVHRLLRREDYDTNTISVINSCMDATCKYLGLVYQTDKDIKSVAVSHILPQLLDSVQQMKMVTTSARELAAQRHTSDLTLRQVKAETRNACLHFIASCYSDLEEYLNEGVTYETAGLLLLQKLRVVDDSVEDCFDHASDAYCRAGEEKRSDNMKKKSFLKHFPGTSHRHPS